MAVPNYTTDLTTLAIGSITVDTGIWDESTDAAWDDAGAMVDDGNLYYNGTACVSAQFTKDGVGTIMYEHGSTFTVPTDGAVLVWHLWAAPPALATETNGGVRILVGNSLGDFHGWNASGNDSAPAPKGGWYQYAVDPSQAHDYLVGTVASPYDTVGMAVSATAQARGNPNACNAIRHGRCAAQYTVGDLSTPATFAGFAALDNASSAKWGLLQDVEGGYKQQGLQSFGLSATAVYFKDANVNITIENTKNTSVNFNRYEVHNASSTLDWTAISISSLGTNSKGQFEVIDNATVNKSACTFTDMSTFKYLSNSTVTSSIYRRCETITQSGSTFDGCLITNCVSTVSILADNLSLITGCTFESDGSNHAVNLGTISTDTSVTWANNVSSYASSNGSTGNEVILVNVASGITLTINVTSGYTSPTYYNTGTGTVTIVSSVTLTVGGVRSSSDIFIYKTSDKTLLASADPVSVTDGSPIGGVQYYKLDYAYDTALSGTSVQVKVFNLDYINERIDYILTSGTAKINIQQRYDRNYQNT